MCLVALVPCMETLLITMVVDAPGQSNVCLTKSEYCSNRLSRSSSLVGSCVGTLLLISFSYDRMVSKISFIVVSGDFAPLVGLSVFLSIFCLSSHESI